MNRLIIPLLFACSVGRLHAMPCDEILNPTPTLQIREVLRVDNAFAVSAPALTSDRQGNVLVAYVNDQGEIPVYALTPRSRHAPFPVWRFPTRQLPFSGENEFVQLAWHINSEGTPVLFVYWIPLEPERYRPRTLYRGLARLHDESVHVTQFALPQSGFFDGIHSLNFGIEFVHWTEHDGKPSRLIDFNLPDQGVDVHDTFGKESLAEAGGGRVLAARVAQHQIEIAHNLAGRWLPLWATPCEGQCGGTSLHTNSRGEMWLAYIEDRHSLVLQDILRPETRHVRRFNRPIGDTPKLYETRDGRLLAFVDLEKDGEFPRGRLMAVDAYDPKSLPRTLTPEAVYFLESSEAFNLNGGSDHYLGLVSQGGLELLNISVNARVTHLGRIQFEGTQRVSWLASRHQQFFAVIPTSPEAQLVLFELLNPLAEKR